MMEKEKKGEGKNEEKILKDSRGEAMEKKSLRGNFTDRPWQRNKNKEHRFQGFDLRHSLKFHSSGKRQRN